jgi:hypothetical protein
VSKAILIAQFLRTRAWWRLDSAGASALRMARSVVALLDAAAYLRDLPEDDPDLLALAARGCFSGGVFDPGPEGADIIRGWQLADKWSAGPRELLAELVRAAHASPAAPATILDAPDASPGRPAIVPRPAPAPEAAWPLTSARRR